MSVAPIPPSLELSRYARHALEAQPALAAELAAPQPFTRAQMDAALNGAQEDDEAALKRRLRRLRQRVMLRTMARDLSGEAELAEVCGAMSDLAELELA
ncbi:MAG: bifunctional [glutamate--ammonia ligase]-adenylyl-L-tyrosine phosphorylase/[glutamate--ammonia-ligase] adenylyltransferase, partial [Burkholderiales bacterium]